MITTSNPYLHLFFSFLKRNGSAGWVYLLAYETDGYTVLQYDTDNKNLMQDMDYLCSLPRQHLYGQVAEQWWQLLIEQGLTEASAPVAEEDSALSSRSSVTAGRRAKLEPKVEHKLFLYLEQQLMGACPSRMQCCQQLQELHGIATAFKEALNDRIQQSVADSQSELAYSELGSSDARQSVTLLNICPWGLEIGKQIDYEFVDGVVVSNVRASHRRPFEFAGIWVELPDNNTLELPVQLGFTDSRQQIVAALNVAQSEQLTTQWCLEHGFRQLALAPSLRQVVEEYGVADAAKPTRRWLSSGQLLVDLAQYCNKVHKDNAPNPVNQHQEVDYIDWDMRIPSLLSDDDSELPF